MTQSLDETTMLDDVDDDESVRVWWLAFISDVFGGVRVWYLVERKARRRRLQML